MPPKCAPGVVDWHVTWHVQDNIVELKAVLASKDQAASLADELGLRMKGELPDARTEDT